MFEKETKFLYDFSMNQIKQLGSYITFDELAALNLHPAIIKYISAEIEYLIYEDRQRLLSSSNFDYSGEEINKYFVLMTREIKRTKKFSLDYFGNIILHAISFSLNYLSQPNWSLVKLIFAKESHLKSAEIVQILKYVYFYSFIPDIIEKYIQKKNLLDVQKSEIEALLSKADKEIYSHSNPKLIDAVLCSMGEFVNIGNFNKTKVPLLMFELFLKEKKLDEFWNKLEGGLGTDIKQMYSISELQRILFLPELAPKIKKENYLDRIVNQDKPLGIFRSKKEAKDDDDQFDDDQFQPDENIVQMIRDSSQPEPEVKDDLVDSAAVQEHKEEFEDIVAENSEESLLINGKDEEKISEEMAETSTGSNVEEIELDMDPEDDFIFLEEENEKEFEDLLSGEQPSQDNFETLLNDISVSPETENLAEPNELSELEQFPEQSQFPEPESLSEAEHVPESEIANSIRIDDLALEEGNSEIAKDMDFLNELEDYFSADESSNTDDHTGINLNEDVHDIPIGIPVEETLSEDVNKADDNEEDIVVRYLNEVQSELETNEEISTSGRKNKVRKKDLAEYFSQREIHKVINTVFNDNMKSFARTFDKLAECENMIQAEAILNSVFVENFVSPDSKGAKIIRKNLQKYYNQV